VRALGEDYDVYAPDAEGATLRRLSFDPEREETPVPFPAARMPRPLKPLWIPSAKIVSRWTPKGPADGPAARPRAVVGAKACDLAALDILDRVLRDAAYTEPTWCAARDQNLVVSGDCTACRDSCFCTTLGGKPWATEGFDLNLAPSGEGYLVEPGSERGEALLARHADFLREASAAEVERRDDLRREVEASVRRQNAAWPVHDPFDVSVEKNLKTRIWGKLAARCVECNACNTVCPTCHCFLLFDRPTEEGSARVSQWDSCFHAGYARMAGGGTPRLQLTERFKNHYYHKFVSFPRNWGVTACTGCGRCVDACMGRIDKRECLHRLEAEWMPSEVLSEIE
jgi:ferredoxin